MKKIIAIVFLLSLFVPTICLAADAELVNHVMAGKIEYVQGQGCFVTGPISIQFEVPAGSAASNHKFTSLDQVLFMAGTFNVKQKIVEDATGAVVVAAQHDSITVKNNQEIRSFSNEWNFAAKVGLYTYQVVVNNEVIATFKISIIAAQ